MHSSKHHVQILTQLLILKGVQEVVVSPGSRNASLVIDFEGSSKLTCRNIVDERSAAYVALGMSQSSRRPVAIVCTSGSAAANYLPAVTEAYYQHIPLIVITADRPQTWIGQGDGQTIQQQYLFGNHVLSSIQMIEGHDDTSLWFNNRVVNEALNTACLGIKGPVHINVPLSEPLYETTSQQLKDVRNIAKVDPAGELSNEDQRYFTDALSSAKRVLILVGMLDWQEHYEWLNACSTLPQVFILSESTSNLGITAGSSCIDRLITNMSAEEEEAFIPDILITLGHSIISKRIKLLLRKHQIKQHWHVAIQDGIVDTFMSMTHHINTDADVFFKSLNISANNESNYNSRFEALEEQKAIKTEKYLSTAAYSDLWVVDQLIRNLPANSILQMGNSSVVRYIQLFNARKDIKYYGNRGVSGIDGCTSTAVGCAIQSDKLVTLISGETAFLYDSNALRNRDLPDHLKLIVINNSGGGIFRIIDGPSKSEYLEKHFESTHDYTCEHIALGSGIRYIKATDKKTLIDGLDELYSKPKIGLLEIFTPRELNPEILAAFFKEIK